LGKLDQLLLQTEGEGDVKACGLKHCPTVTRGDNEDRGGKVWQAGTIGPSR
jgi:hypothetical protein